MYVFLYSLISSKHVNIFTHKVKKITSTKWKEIKSKTEYKKKSKDLTVHQINNISTLNMRKRKISPNNF